MTCNTPKKDDSAKKCCGGGCHSKDDFKDACATKPTDPAPQTPPEAPKGSSCCGGPAKDGPCCKP